MNKGLQKLPVSDSKIRGLLKRDQVTMADIDKLSEAEKKRLGEISTEKLKKISATDRDEFLEKIKDIVAEQTITELWEYNHGQIMYAISSLINESGRMPTRTQIAERANVSRTTVYKHLKDYSTHPLYLEQLQKLRLLSTNVIARVYRSAMAGDTGSQKLYFNVMGLLGGGQGSKIQNNYIQINNMILRQDVIQKLNPEQLSIIENLLKSILPQQELSLNK